MTYKFPLDYESTDISLAEPELQDKWEDAKEKCLKRGLHIHTGTVVRGPVAQAKLWCASRTRELVELWAEVLSKSAPLLSKVLLDQPCGLWPAGQVDLPGASWHQWGAAVDMAVYHDNGKQLAWEGSLMRAAAELIEETGLYHSYFQDWDPRGKKYHVQLTKKESPLLMRGLMDSWADLEREMLVRWPQLELYESNRT